MYFLHYHVKDQVEITEKYILMLPEGLFPDICIVG